MMNIARMVFPGFWFGQSSEEEAIRLAGLGVGGFCLYGGTKTAVCLPPGPTATTPCAPCTPTTPA